MSNNKEANVEAATDIAHQKNRRLISVLSIILLSGLLVLRFPYLILVSYKIISINSSANLNIFLDGTYVMTALLIFLQRDSLAEHHIGFCALMMFILLPFFKSAACLLSSFGSVPWIQIVASSCLFIALLILRPKLRHRKTRELLLWLLVAVVSGIGLGILSGYLISSQSGRSPQHATVSYFVVSILWQLGNAAVSEEPLFRGFLWGFLKKAHWKDVWIWLFQAALFMLGHIYYFGIANISFFLVVPIGGLVLGLLAWRSRSIGTSMISHGLTNTIGDIMAHFTW